MRPARVDSSLTSSFRGHDGSGAAVHDKGSVRDDVASTRRRRGARGPIERSHAMRPPITPTSLLLALVVLLGSSSPLLAQVDDREVVLRAHLADIELQWEISGDPASLLPDLEELFADVLDDPEFDGQVSVLADVIVARAEAYLEAGDAMGAEDSLTLLIAHPDHRPDIATANMLWDMARARPQVQELMARVESGGLVTSASGVGGEIAETVAEALAEGDVDTLADLGERAVPALIERLEPGAGNVPQWNREPYAWLLRLGPDQGLPILRDHLERGVLMRTERALTALDQYVRNRGKEMYLMTPGRPGRLADQDVEAILHTLIGQPWLWGDPAAGGAGRAHQDGHDVVNAGVMLQQLVRGLGAMDAFDPELASAAGRAMLLLSAERCREVQRQIMPHGQRPSMEPLWATLLGHADAVVRRTAAERLSQLTHASALMDAVDDPDPGVREWVAKWYVPGAASFPVYQSTGVGSRTEQRWPEVRPETRPVLAALCRDPSRAVRLMAVKGLLALDEPLEDAVYEELARDEDPRVRSELAALTRVNESALAHVFSALARDPDPMVRFSLAGSTTMPSAVATVVFAELAADEDAAVRERVVEALGRSAAPVLPLEVLLRLADDPDSQVRARLAEVVADDPVTLLPVFERLADDADPRVVDMLDSRLADILNRGQWRTDVQGVLDLLTHRRFDRVHPLGEHVNNLDWWAIKLTNMGAEGRRTLVEWALRDGGDQAWRAVTGQLMSRGQSQPNQSMTELAQGWLGLDDDGLMELAVRLDASDTLGNWVLQSALDPLTPERDDFARRLLAEQGDRPELALLGARALARSATPEELSRVREILVAIDTTEHLTSDTLALAGVVIEHLPDDVLNGFIRTLVLDEDRSDALRQQVAGELRRDLPGALACALTIVETLGGIPDLRCVDRAVDALVEDAPDALETQWILDRVWTPYGFRLIRVLVNRRDPAIIPVLTDALPRALTLRKLWGAYSEDGYVTHRTLVSWLVSFNSDEAAQILLDAAGEATNATVRETFMDGVTRIQEWQDARARWEERLATRTTREGAITELLTLLEDEDPVLRAEAARGLATLQAVEHLPKLVRMLKDENPSVAAAARKALDRLHELAAADGG